MAAGPATTNGKTSHRHAASVSQAQNHKAQLANAYNELGKELSSQKIRVVGNYTLGKVIGEGAFPAVLFLTHPSAPCHGARTWARVTGADPRRRLQGRMGRCGWAHTA